MTNWKKLRQRADFGLRRVLHYTAPAAKVIGEATKIISTIQKPGVIAVTNAVTSGLSTLADLVTQPEEAPVWMMNTYLTQGDLEAAFDAAGWPRELHREGDNGKTTLARWHIDGNPDIPVRADNSGQVWFWNEPEIVRRRVRDAIDGVLAPHLHLTYQETDNNKKADAVHGVKLTDLTPKDTHAVLHRSLKLAAAGHRAILIEGRPGVGKTTMAQAMARDSGFRRVLLVDNTYLFRGLSREALGLISPDVIIVDDIDKVTVRLQAFELLRNTARLLICTANNGAFDAVIDAALARPGRIDETFTITSQSPFRRPPFDRFNDEQWAVISQWPQAYLNELEQRLLHTPNDLRLADMAQRLGRRTQSAAGLLGQVEDPPDLSSLAAEIEPWDGDLP